MTRQRSFLRSLLLALLLGLMPVILPVLAVLSAPPAFAQDAQPLPDFAAWDRISQDAETTLSNDRISVEKLDALRKDLVDWRARFSAAQSANSGQIDTVKGQISSLGPPPAEGSADDPAIAARRAELNEQLGRLQAPGLKSVEAYSQADGLIRQIDGKIRARQASELLRLSPTPLNPVNWPSGFAVLTQGGMTLWKEIATAWNDPASREHLRNNIVVVLLLLAVAGVLMIRGASFIERLVDRMLSRTTLSVRDLAAALISLGQVLVPVGGVLLLYAAIDVSGLTGRRSGALASALPSAAFAFFLIRWIGSWIFGDRSRRPLTDRNTEARILTNILATVAAVEILRQAFVTEVHPPVSMAAQAVWGTPLVIIAGIFLFRFAQLLRPRHHGLAEARALDFRSRMINIVATAAMAVAVLAPILAVAGYVALANSLMWPTLRSLGLAGLLMLLQRFTTDLYVAVTRSGEAGRERLAPVMFGLIYALVSIPFFALIWGMRLADLAELWTRFSEGMTVGTTRISPSVLVTFIIIFAIGYGLTRLFQSALKSAILPRTQLEKGAQNAITSGLGYVGIFLAALMAITGAGIDMSALGYVAGALSVGIGFGLQNIVQNFVSGIILLIERPISEGDMITVNGQSGTVRRISVRSTWIETFDRTDVIVPNADLVSGVVTNLTRGNLTGRMILPVGVGYDSDTRKVEAILLEIAEGEPLVLVDPAPSVVFVGLGASSLNFEIRAILSDVNFRLAVQTDMLHKIVERFRKEGIEIPFPQSDIWVRNARELTGTATAGADAAQIAFQHRDDSASDDAPDAATISNDPDADEDPDRR